MLFKPNELGEQITAQHLKQIADANRESRNAYYSRRYAMYKGIATDPNEPDYNESLCLEFFPKGKNETTDEYRERMKVWIPQGTVIINRLADMCFKGGVEYKFVAINEADEEMAKAATANFNADLEYNHWDIVGRERVLEPLAIGQISDWLDYRRHDPKTGELFDNGGRIRYIKRWPWFAEPVVHPDNVTEIIGAAYIYNLENEVISPAVSLQMQLNGERVLVTELWLDPAYNTDSGEVKSLGAFVRLENETVAMPDGKEDWATENKYKLTPVVFWQSIDLDESQYNAEAFVDRFVDMWIKLSRVSSNELSGIQYILNQKAIIAAPEATPDELPARHNAVLKIPQGDPQSSVQNMPRNLDLAPEKEFKQYLLSQIGEAGGYSADLMSVDGAGKISESGVARKIVYEKTVDTVRTIRKNFAKGLKELMRKSLAVKAYENSGTLEGVDLTKIRPEVIFDDNIMPLDEMIALEYDLLLLKNQLVERERLVMQYNPDIRTKEEAEAFVKEQKDANPEEPRSPFQLRRPRGTGNPPNENQNA